jgi:hypothetical protein
LNNKELGRSFMTITLKGKIENRAIKIPRWVKIPDGTRVTFNIKTFLTKEDKKEIAQSLRGAWAKDTSINSIFNKIDKKRHKYRGRIPPRAGEVKRQVEV